MNTHVLTAALFPPAVLAVRSEQTWPFRLLEKEAHVQASTTKPPSSGAPKRLSRAQEETQTQEQQALLNDLHTHTDLNRVERRLRVEGLVFTKRWSANESASDAQARADIRVDRAYEAWWALELFQGDVMTKLLSLPAKLRESLFRQAPSELTVIIPNNRMSRVRKGGRITPPPRWISHTSRLRKTVPTHANRLDLPKRPGVLFRNTTILTRVVKRWICQLGPFDKKDTWRAIMDAVNLCEAQRRNDDVLLHGFLKGGNRGESQDGQDRRMPVTMDDLIPITEQTKLKCSAEPIPRLDAMLLKLLTEAGSLAEDDLLTVNQAATQQSETFSHSEASEMVPWDIAQHIRSAPQSLQDAQTALTRYQFKGVDSAETDALYRLADWIETQERLVSRKRHYGNQEDPEFVETLFSPERRLAPCPVLPSYLGFTAILGDTVSDLPVTDQWHHLTTLPVRLRPLLHPDDRLVTTATPGVGSVAAVVGKKLGCDVHVLNVHTSFHESFRAFHKQAMNGLEPLHVPEHHASQALVAMMCASRVYVITALPCDTDVHLGPCVLRLPKVYAAALTEAVHFRGARPEVNVIQL